jgi:hypothetical protein
MADFDSHKNQVKSNLNTLEIINEYNNLGWDWQVTIAFYSALHLINAHLAQSMDMHYRSHKDVNEAIDFGNTTSLGKLPREIYERYRALLNLSRRSRYLVNEDPNNRENRPFLTSDRHFGKAIRHLDIIIDYMKSRYQVDCPKRNLKCIELRQDSLHNFNVKS